MIRPPCHRALNTPMSILFFEHTYTNSIQRQTTWHVKKMHGTYYRLCSRTSVHSGFLKPLYCSFASTMDVIWLSNVFMHLETSVSPYFYFVNKISHIFSLYLLTFSRGSYTEYIYIILDLLLSLILWPQEYFSKLWLLACQRVLL